ncbi:hypothetical protein O181_104490 [Austropuccinia psidii MF-1]|uniref:Uncharacterized protein n=1 Tax=Austropuccinia psidii MF-1 TaxID=1389203 RepID=A0A9Q3JNL8_9BASI|nr:hypothetical protein [Austropuccinia psidii MF-1]
MITITNEVPLCREHPGLHIEPIPGKSYPLCHSHSNSTETSNQRTGRIWIKFFSSTNSSKTFFNGAWIKRGSFQEKTRIQGQKQDHLQPKEQRFRPNDLEAVGFGERCTQEPEVVVHNSRISSPIDRNITPTQIEHNVVTPESNLKGDAMWLQMSQDAEQTQKKFSELEAIHETMKKMTASMEKIVKPFKKDMLN